MNKLVDTLLAQARNCRKDAPHSPRCPRCRRGTPVAAGRETQGE
ncbi:hypothetical protein [Gordonia sp. PP30]|nr:hypothetical protein [Gordonia sp. PP30]